MTDKCKKASGDLAAITSFNKGHGLSKVKLGPKAKNMWFGENRRERKPPLTYQLYVPCWVKGRRAFCLFLCLFLIPKRMDAICFSIHTARLSGVAQVIFHVRNNAGELLFFCGWRRETLIIVSVYISLFFVEGVFCAACTFVGG